jgi:hypothetical protein
MEPQLVLAEAEGGEEASGGAGVALAQDGAWLAGQIVSDAVAAGMATAHRPGISRLLPEPAERLQHLGRAVVAEVGGPAAGGRRELGRLAPKPLAAAINAILGALSNL